MELPNATLTDLTEAMPRSKCDSETTHNSGNLRNSSIIFVQTDTSSTQGLAKCQFSLTEATSKPKYGNSHRFSTIWNTLIKSCRH